MGKRKSDNISMEPEAKKSRQETSSEQTRTQTEVASTYNDSYLLRKSKQAAAMKRPKLYLTMEGLWGGDAEVSSTEKDLPASDKTKKATPPTLYVRDLQYLLIYALRKGLNCFQPRWCRMLRPGKVSSVVMIVLADTSVSDFYQHKECFPFLNESFQQDLRAEIVNPCKYFSSFNFDMYAIPMTETYLNYFQNKYGSHHIKEQKIVFPKPASIPEDKLTSVQHSGPKTAAQNSDKDSKNTGETEKKKEEGENSGALPTNGNNTGSGSDLNSVEKDEGETDVVDRTQLLLNVEQMVVNKYPMPDDQEKDEKYKNFVHTKEKYTPVTSQSRLFAVDCEMCLTSSYQHELTRVSIVDQHKNVIYDELVKPYNPIVDYLTRYSGITKKLLDPVTKRIEDVQREIRELIPDDAILCGQSLGNDLHALKMFHPYVIDTSVIYNVSGSRRMKCGLKRLAYGFLQRVIQDSSAGHSSAEDAIATMDLVLLKLGKSLTFGDAVLDGDIGPYIESFCADINPAPSTTDASKKAKDTKTEEKKDQSKVVMMRSLFDLLYRQEISACLIGQQAVVAKYEEEPGVKCCRVDNDQDACKMAADLSSQHQFTWVQFSKFTNGLTSEDFKGMDNNNLKQLSQTSSAETSVKMRKKWLRRLDKEVKRLTSQVPDKSLVTVVMTGRSSNQHEHAAVFLHIS